MFVTPESNHRMLKTALSSLAEMRTLMIKRLSEWKSEY